MRTFSTLPPAFLVRENQSSLPTVYRFSPLNAFQMSRLDWVEVLDASPVITESGQQVRFIRGWRLASEIQFQFYDPVAMSSPLSPGVTEEAMLDIMLKLRAGWIVEFRPHYDADQQYNSAYDCWVSFRQDRRSLPMSRVIAEISGKYIVSSIPERW